MAGNPELISRARQVDEGLVDVAALSEASGRRTARGASSSAWLDPYVEFMALRDLLDHAQWPAWEPGAPRPRSARVADGRSRRTPDALEAAALRAVGLRRAVARLKEYAASRGVLLFGDLPIFVSHDSADVWAARELFRARRRGAADTVTGVPAGLLREGRAALEQPALRLGRGWPPTGTPGGACGSPVSASSSTSCGSTTSAGSRPPGTCRSRPRPPGTAYWVQSPGREVLAALVETAGPGTLVAEDLGVITPEVDELRTGVRRCPA